MGAGCTCGDLFLFQKVEERGTDQLNKALLSGSIDGVIINSNAVPALQQACFASSCNEACLLGLHIRHLL